MPRKKPKKGSSGKKQPNPNVPATIVVPEEPQHGVPFRIADLNQKKYKIPLNMDEYFDDDDDEEQEEVFCEPLRKLFALVNKLHTQHRDWALTPEGKKALAAIKQRVDDIIGIVYENQLIDTIPPLDARPIVDGSWGMGTQKEEVMMFLSMLGTMTKQKLSLHDLGLGQPSAKAPSKWSSPLSRFYGKYTARRYEDGFGDQTVPVEKQTEKQLLKAVYEARCEIEVHHSSVPHGAYLSEGVLGFLGGTGWKLREPYASVFIHKTAEKEESKIEIPRDILRRDSKQAWTEQPLDSGLYDAGSVVLVDTKRNIAWFAGDERLKGIDYTTGQTNYTLYTGQSATSLAIVPIDNEDHLVATVAGGNKLYMWKLKDLVVQTTFYDVEDLEELRSDKKKMEDILDLTESTWRDELEDIELSKGTRPMLEVPIMFGDTPVQTAVGARLYSSSPLDLAVADNYAIYLVQSKTGMAFAQLLGHTSDIEALKSSPDVPNYLASASRDSTARIWNVLTGLCEVVLDGGSQVQAPLYSVDITRIGDAIICFTGGADECVKVWDVTTRSCLYELSSGNCHVHKVLWQRSLSTLAVVVEDLRQDRIGYHHGYDDDDDDEDEDDDDEEEEEKGPKYPWPKDACHEKSDFKQLWTNTEPGVIFYTFKSNPNNQEQDLPHPDISPAPY